MTTVIGPGVDRVDGPAKVRGAAAYPTDVTYPDLAHAALVRSTIASGRLIEIDDADARAAAGVLTVIQDGPKLTPAPFGLLGLLRRRPCRTTASITTDSTSPLSSRRRRTRPPRRHAWSRSTTSPATHS